MTHFLGTGSLASAILFCFSLSATITQVAAYVFSPDLHTRLPGRAHSLSDPCCHKVSYMLLRVTKLPDAGDKGVRPGREAARIKKSGCFFHPTCRSVTDCHPCEPGAVLWVSLYFSPSLFSPCVTVTPPKNYSN